jgi:putative ABC transport system substrate-binding protein
MDRLSALAAELLSLNVDIIVTDGGPAATAAKQATATIPIVIGAATSEFLMQQGLVQSLARPGGNITGSPSPRGRSCTANESSYCAKRSLV